MPGYTTPDNLPYPNDYNADADVPINMQSLANATQAALDKKASDQSVVIAGNGLIGGGGIELTPTLSVGKGVGIIVGTDLVSLDKAYTDTLYAPKSLSGQYARVWIGAQPSAPAYGDIWVP